MDLFNLLQSLEKFLFEIALWFYLVPKMFLKVLLQPAWAYNYVSEEMQKKETERYDHYLSPLIFFVLVSVVPWLFIVFNYKELLRQIVNTSIPLLDNLEYAVLILALLNLANPLWFSILIQKAKKELVGRKSIERIFHIQCLYFAIANFFLFIAVNLYLAQMAVFQVALFGIFLPALLWLVYAQWYLLSHELNLRSGHALRLAVQYLVWAFFSDLRDRGTDPFCTLPQPCKVRDENHCFGC